MEVKYHPQNPLILVFSHQPLLSSIMALLKKQGNKALLPNSPSLMGGPAHEPHLVRKY